MSDSNTDIGFELAKRLIDLCKQRDRTLSTAESCTGGLIAAQITAVPGASDVYRGSVVSYATSVKHDTLGVPQIVLDTQGPVCMDCAKAMAIGARLVLHTTLGCSVTGYAGPAGGTKADPVGTVYFGIATIDRVYAQRFLFAGDREAVRRQAVIHALSMLILSFDLPPKQIDE